MNEKSKIETRGKLHLKRKAIDITPFHLGKPKFLAYFISHQALSTSKNKIRICKLDTKLNYYKPVADARASVKDWDYSKNLIAIIETLVDSKPGFNIFTSLIKTSNLSVLDMQSLSLKMYRLIEKKDSIKK